LTDKEQTKNKWIPFTYFGPGVRKITNIFKSTNIKIAFRTMNTIQQQLARQPHKEQNPSGIYKIICNTCKGHM